MAAAAADLLGAQQVLSKFQPDTLLQQLGGDIHVCIVSTLTASELAEQVRGILPQLLIQTVAQTCSHMTQDD